jgi:hypothetical protein
VHLLIRNAVSWGVFAEKALAMTADAFSAGMQGLRHQERVI